MEYCGYKIVKFSNSELAQFYEGGSGDFDLLENEFLLVQNSEEEIVDKYVLQEGKLRRVGYTKFENGFTGVIKPRNPEQEILFNMLSDSRSTVKLVTGGFGCGKTFSLVVAALEALHKGKFDKIVWVRNNIDVKDTTPLGALPGDSFDKLLPFVMPLADHAGGIEGIKLLMDKDQLEVVHLGYLRGRDIKNAIILCSEAENLTKQHIQLLIGRVGEGSNLWMDADLKQRDKVVFEKSAGLETMIDRLKGNELFGYVKLLKTERSQTARLADLLDD